MMMSLSWGCGGWAWCSAGRKYATVTSLEITEWFSFVRTTVTIGSVMPRYSPRDVKEKGHYYLSGRLEKLLAWGLLPSNNNETGNWKGQNLIACGKRSLACGLTQGVLLADVSHYLHETIADALFVSVLTHCYTSPVAFFIVAFLIQQLPTLERNRWRKTSRD